jgi:oligopeptide/dipeptide ABC transporter ATP-binding protein
VDFTTGKGLLQAVRGVDFELGEGEILGIVGESGSGKSVSAHSLLRLTPGNGRISRGVITYRGQAVLDLSPDELRRYRGGRVSIIFQEPARSFDPIYSIGKALDETLITHFPEMSESDRRDKAIQLLQEVNVPRAEERLGNFPHQFSGGLLQRIMIALALASDPDVLIADEPTTALDVTIQAQIIDLLLELKERRGLSIIFISHDLSLIGSIADRIMVMYAGLVMETGPAEQVLNSPRHPYSRALLDSILDLDAHYSEVALRTVPGTIPDAHTPEPGCPFAPRCPQATDGCRAAVPALVRDSDGSEAHAYRCIVPGVKTPTEKKTHAHA